MTGFFGGYSVKSDELGQRELAAARHMATARNETGRALLVHSMHYVAMPNDALREREVPVFAAAEDGIEALARAVRWQQEPMSPLPLPAPAPPVMADDYWTARQLLADAGLPMARARLVLSGETIDISGLTFPLVAKALGQRHKSDSGGVVLGISDEAELAAVLDDLRIRLDPPAVAIEEQAPVHDGVELIVGCRHDPSFGPLLMVGLGGIYAEIMQDTAIALAPLDVDAAEALLRGLRGAALLTGARGRPPLDLAGAAMFASRLSLLAAAHPEISELEVNPLLVLPDRVIALDARVALISN
jgi:acyl-CoA synthetase (NDP forming)